MAAGNILQIMKQNQLETMLIFAARYAHNRPTGAALAVCNVIMQQWNNLRRDAQIQIQKESFDATENQSNWQEIRKLKVKDT